MSNPTKNLVEWLKWQDCLHVSTIDLSLDRVRKVAQYLDILTLPLPLISVAGTNGKGSSVAMLDAIFRADHYTTGTYTTPHLLKYNERIAISGVAVSDETLCDAFAQIDKARDNISLTSFEFGTLAAVLIFIQQQVDVVILEVGLGGRLDAVNVWDADVALITSIGIDHTEWLGDTREAIGFEKAGIMRPATPVVCGDLKPPKSIATYAKKIGADLWQASKNFIASSAVNHDWCLCIIGKNKNQTEEMLLPLPALKGDVQIQNAATVITALKQLMPIISVSHHAIKTGLQNVSLLGRLQKLQSCPEILLDVAHNAHAAKELARFLKKNPTSGKTHAIFSILNDKDISAVLAVMNAYIDHWHILPLVSERALPVKKIALTLQENGFYNLSSHKSFQHCLKYVINTIDCQDRVVAFGSFLVVSAVMSAYRT